MNAYDSYAQALAVHELAFRLAEETGYTKVRDRSNTVINKALKLCVKEIPERLLTHSIIGETSDHYRNTRFDEAVERYFKGKPVYGDSESSMLCIRCGKDIANAVVTFLKKKAEFEYLDVDKSGGPSVQGLYNWTEAKRYCVKKKIPVKLDLTDKEKKEIKKRLNEIMEKASAAATEEMKKVEAIAHKYNIS